MKRTIPSVIKMNFKSPSLHYSIDTVTTTNSSFRLYMHFQLYFDHGPKINFFFIISFAPLSLAITGTVASTFATLRQGGI